MTKDDIISMAREAGFEAQHDASFMGIKPIIYAGNINVTAAIEHLFAAAYARGVAAESRRADALAAVVAELRDIVTSEAESKADFIARVRDVLGSCPDQRVIKAVDAEREACARVCENGVDTEHPTVKGHIMKDFGASSLLASAIRARGEK